MLKSNINNTNLRINGKTSDAKILRQVEAGRRRTDVLMDDLKRHESDKIPGAVMIGSPLCSPVIRESIPSQSESKYFSVISSYNIKH